MKKANKCDIIVTYCWNRVGYNILRSLSSHGLCVWAADSSKYNICSMSRYCAGSFVYPNPFVYEEEFIQCLLKKVEQLSPRILMPTHDEGIIISRHRNRFPKNLIIATESSDKLLKLSNKVTATQLAEQAGVPIPKVYNSNIEPTTFPVVFKTAIGNSAKGVFFPKTQEELVEISKKHDGIETLTEEWIGGGDICVDCIRYHSFFKASVYKAIITKTHGGGTTTQREIIEMPQLVEYAKRLLDHINYNGVCGIDFRVDSNNNRVAFIEANARYTGGLATPIAAGFDIPFIYYQLLTGGKTPQQITPRIGTKTKWILGDIITMVGRILSLKFNKTEWRNLCSFSGFNAFDDYTSGDIKAFVGELLYYLLKLIKNRRLNP